MEILGDVLLKFRTGRFGFVADNSKAFLRISLTEADRNYANFVWPEDSFQTGGRIKTYRFQLVMFGSCFSPFLLWRTPRHHFQHLEIPEIGHFFMDSFKGIVESEIERRELYHFSRQKSQKVNMELQCYRTLCTSKGLQEIRNPLPASSTGHKQGWAIAQISKVDQDETN